MKDSGHTIRGISFVPTGFDENGMIFFESKGSELRTHAGGFDGGNFFEIWYLLLLIRHRLLFIDADIVAWDNDHLLRIPACRSVRARTS